jgi:hypothetical protein
MEFGSEVVFLFGVTTYSSSWFRTLTFLELLRTGVCVLTVSLVGSRLPSRLALLEFYPDPRASFFTELRATEPFLVTPLWLKFIC